MEVTRKVPQCTEHIDRLFFVLPAIKPHFEHHVIPLTVPRFVEVPIPNDILHPSLAARAEMSAKMVNDVSNIFFFLLSSVL